jgi:membrane protein DedA with SNARE-associated domain
MDPLKNFVLQLLTTYRMLAVLIGSFFFGETIILAASILAFRFNWPIIEVFVVAFVGTLASDLLWYLFGMRMFNLFKKRENSFSEKYKNKLYYLERALHSRDPFRILLYIKFLYGTRILTLIYLSMHKVRLKKFLLFDAIGTLVWLSSLMFLAYLVTFGVFKSISIFHEFTLILTSLFVSLVLLRFIVLWITKRIQKE